MVPSRRNRTPFNVAGGLALAVLATLVVLGLRIASVPFLGYGSPYLPFLFAVGLSAYYGGLGSGALATILGALGVRYFLIEPLFSFASNHEESPGRLVMFVAVGLISSALIEVMHRERRRAELSEDRIEAILSSITDCYYALDTRFRFREINDNACAYFERSRDEILGRNIGELFPSWSGSVLEQKYREAQSKGEPVHFETASVISNGRFAEIHAHPSGEGLEVYFREITARKQAEAKIEGLLASERKARGSAEAASKAKDEFLAVLSHELRTPLSPVLLSVEALQEETRLPEDVRAELDLIRRNVQAEARLIDDLLDLNRVARGKLVLREQDVDLHAALTHALRTCCAGELREKSLRINKRLDARAFHVRGDEGRLHQVFWNLLRNAVKFTPSGGEISIRSWNPQPNRIGVEVCDTGIGISPEILPRLFSAFEQGGDTTTHRFGGLGLGLAICRGIVELHGGSIRAASGGRDRGACFTVELTAREASPQAAEDKNPIRSTPAHHRLRILLVEDHEHTLKTLAKLLAREHEVKAASNVSSARALAACEKFDLLVSDLGLPDGSGCDLMRELRRRQPELPGIALSGYGMERDFAYSRDAGFECHLVKPVGWEQLRTAIQTAAVH